jgi:hypothetical protein
MLFIPPLGAGVVSVGTESRPILVWDYVALLLCSGKMMVVWHRRLQSSYWGKNVNVNYAGYHPCYHKEKRNNGSEGGGINREGGEKVESEGERRTGRRKRKGRKRGKGEI